MQQLPKPVLILGGIVSIWILAIVIVNAVGPTSSVGKLFSWAVPKGLVFSSAGVPAATPTPAPSVAGPTIVIPAAAAQVIPAAAAQVSSAPAAAGAATTGGAATQTFKSGKLKAQCPTWKDTYGKLSSSLQNFNPGMFSKESPNLRLVANYCGLGDKIMTYCTNLEDILGIKDTQYPNPNACDTIDCLTAPASSEITYSKLCKSMECTTNNSDFIGYEWTIASGADGNVSNIFSADGNLKFNIFAVDSNPTILNAFCDTGRRMLADPNCLPQYQDYVSNSPAFKYFCCNDTACCPDHSKTCVGKPKCLSKCTQAAANCLLSKGEFVSNSYNYTNFNDASLSEDENVKKMLDYCSFGDDLIAADCSIDRYHPSASRDTAYVLNPGSPTPKTPASIYNQYCNSNPACLAQRGKYNAKQWSYQYNYNGVSHGNDNNLNLSECTGNPSETHPECNGLCTPEESAYYKDGITSCTTNPDSTECNDKAKKECVDDCNLAMYNSTCKISENGRKFTDFCDMGTNLYQNKCYDNYTVDPSNDNAASYPPITYDMSYIGLCCPYNSKDNSSLLGDKDVCNTNPNVMSQIQGIVPDSQHAHDTNKTIYKYLKGHNLKIQKQ